MYKLALLRQMKKLVSDKALKYIEWFDHNSDVYQYLQLKIMCERYLNENFKNPNIFCSTSSPLKTCEFFLNIEIPKKEILQDHFIVDVHFLVRLSRPFSREHVEEIEIKSKLIYETFIPGSLEFWENVFENCKLEVIKG